MPRARFVEGTALGIGREALSRLLFVVPEQRRKRLVRADPVDGTKDQRVDQKPDWIQDVGDHAKRMAGLLIVIVIGTCGQRGAQKAQGERTAHRETSNSLDSVTHFGPLSRHSRAAATAGSHPIASGFPVHRILFSAGEQRIL
jgi:hypothetical protein